jgi:hypothetical protein
VYQRPPGVIPEPNQTNPVNKHVVNPTDKTKRTATFQPYSNLATETMGPGKPVTATGKKITYQQQQKPGFQGIEQDLNPHAT